MLLSFKDKIKYFTKNTNYYFNFCLIYGVFNFVELQKSIL